MLLIGLGHRSGHGKDTAANFVVDWFALHNPTLRVRKIPWAWKLKDICHQLYGHLGLQPAEFYDTPAGRQARNTPLPRINKTPVEIWIDMGTPAVREQVWDETWVDYVRNISGADVVIAPDTRFPNEAAVCDYLIKVSNPRVADRGGKSIDDVLADFPSWDGYSGWNAEFINDAGLPELRAVIDDWCQRVFPEQVGDPDVLRLAIEFGYKNLDYAGNLIG